KSAVVTEAQAGPARIELTGSDGADKVPKDTEQYPAGTVAAAPFMSSSALDRFRAEQTATTRADGTLYSLHLKATMMKDSLPVPFGHAVRAYLKPVFDRYGADLAAAGVNPNSGLGAMLDTIAGMPKAAEIEVAIKQTLASRPPLYMVNSDKGITY